MARRMKQLGLVAKARRKFKVTTDSNHALPVAPNLLNRDFTAQAPNQNWVSDISYIKRIDMNLEVLIDTLMEKYPGLVKTSAWGETSLFYNPEGLLKRGVYCFTFKLKDGENDSASNLDREIVNYRMNFKLNKPHFLAYFEEPALPKRPAKGEIIFLESGKAYDPTILNKLFPHPVYAWMSWVSIINPSSKTIKHFISDGLIDEPYQDAVMRYEKKQRSLLCDSARQK